MTEEEFGKMVAHSEDAAELIYQCAWFYGAFPLEVGFGALMAARTGHIVEAIGHADAVRWSDEALKAARGYKAGSKIDRLFKAPVTKFLLRKYAGSEEYLNQRATYLHILGAGEDGLVMSRQTTAVALVEKAGHYEVWVSSNSVEYLTLMQKNYARMGGERTVKIAERFIGGPDPKQVSKLNNLWRQNGFERSTLYHAEKNLIIAAETQGARIIGIATQGRTISPTASEREICYRCGNWVIEHGIEILSPARWEVPAK
jgi:hypothetical protein